jgi:hypothetical protein
MALLVIGLVLVIPTAIYTAIYSSRNPRVQGDPLSVQRMALISVASVGALFVISAAVLFLILS